jgi:hypothetical protein
MSTQRLCGYQLIEADAHRHRDITSAMDRKAIGLLAPRATMIPSAQHARPLNTRSQESASRAFQMHCSARWFCNRARLQLSRKCGQDYCRYCRHPAGSLQEPSQSYSCIRSRKVFDCGGAENLALAGMPSPASTCVSI